jgi:YaiO family outer membrane protein
MKRIIIIFHFVLFLIYSFSFAQSSEILQKKADSLLIKGLFSQAEVIYKSLLEKSPDNTDILLSLGRLDYYAGNYKEAEDRLVSALKLAPKYEDIYEILSNVYLSQGKLDESNFTLEKLSALNPKRSDILVKSLINNRNFGNYIKAREIQGHLIENGFKDSIPEHFQRDLMKFQIDIQGAYENVDPKPDWNDQLFTFMYIYDKYFKFLASAQRAERFGLNNTMLSLSTYFPFPRNFNWYINFGFTPNSLIFPETRIDIYLQALLYKATSAIAAIGLLNFTAQKIQYYQLGIDQYFGDYSATYQFFFSKSLSATHSIRLSWYGEDSKASIGFITGNESYNLYSNYILDIHTTSIYGGYFHWLTKNIGIQADISYSHTSQAQNRIRYGLGLSMKF